MAHGNGGFPDWWWLWMAFVVGVIVWQNLRLRRHGRDLLQFANRSQLQAWGDDSLPDDLTLSDSSFYPVRRIFNIFGGKANGLPVAVFDVAKRAGKSTAYFTVIAVRSTRDPFGAEAFDPELTVERCGEWVLLYRPSSLSLRSRLLGIEEIEAQLASVGPR